MGEGGGNLADSNNLYLQGILTIYKEQEELDFEPQPARQLAGSGTTEVWKLLSGYVQNTA